MPVSWKGIKFKSAKSRARFVAAAKRRSRPKKRRRK